MDQGGRTHPKGQQAMNRDEGSYQLSQAYDRFLDMASSHRVNNRKNWVPASSDEGL